MDRHDLLACEVFDITQFTAAKKDRQQPKYDSIDKANCTNVWSCTFTLPDDTEQIDFLPSDTESNLGLK